MLWTATVETAAEASPLRLGNLAFKETRSEGEGQVGSNKGSNGSRLKELLIGPVRFKCSCKNVGFESDH